MDNLPSARKLSVRCTTSDRLMLVWQPLEGPMMIKADSATDAGEGTTFYLLAVRAFVLCYRPDAHDRLQRIACLVRPVKICLFRRSHRTRLLSETWLLI